MSLLKDAIRSIGSRPLAPLRFPERTAVEAAAARLPDGTSDGPRKGRNYDEIAGELLRRIGTGEVCPQLTSKEARDAAWCLWATTPALADHPGPLRCILNAVEAAPRQSPGRALAAAYMSAYAPDRAGIQEASAVLERLTARLGRPWTGLHDAYRLFHHREGPDRVARRALAERTSPTAVLRAGGLGALDGRSGFARACTGALLAEIARDAGSEPRDRLALVQRVALGPEGRLLFDEHAPLVADALTKPFRDALPEKDVRDAYLSVLLALFKDPRLYPGNWARMPEAADTVRRWLTEQSLRQFLDIVGRGIQDQQHMWAPRRRFWEAVYEAGLISQAWVVFEPAGQQLARRVFGRTASFGAFGGVQAGQAVLLLQVGRGLVIEWSHTGRCIIYNDAEAARVPKLYRKEYDAFELRAPDGATDNVGRSVFAVRHWPHEGQNSWQRKVAAKLHQMTGVRLRPEQFEA